MKTVKFDRDYSKLNDEFFTTLRKNDKHIFNNEIVLIKSPSKEFKAICDGSGRVKFRNIPIGLLSKDLDKLFRVDLDVSEHEQALKIIQKIPNYNDLTLDSFVYLYNFKKV